MKKTITIIAALFIMLISCVSCVRVPYIPDRNAGGETTLEFWIAQDMKDEDLSGHDEIYGWMGAREYLGSGYKKLTDADGTDARPTFGVGYILTAYPDYADGGQYVTTIWITDPEVKVYGLTVDSAFEEFDSVFENLGFELSDGDGAIPTRVAQKDGITFRLSTKPYEDSDFIPQLTINADVTNRTGIVY